MSLVWLRIAFSLWLNQHVDQAESIAQLALSNAQKRLRSSKKVVRKKVASGPALPGKLADCSAQDSGRTELFLVEGDSAGGSAKQARNREFQAVMPLRGKILKTAGKSIPVKCLALRKFMIYPSLSASTPVSDNLSGLRYGKVCILADADSDGLHIANPVMRIICTAFSALSHGRACVCGNAAFVPH